jgi:hypothetical protein
LAFKIGRKNKFHWGLNIDDIWSYAGLAIPKSVVIPYLFSLGLRGGPFTLPQGQKVADMKRRKWSLRSANATTKKRDARRPAELLASFLKKNGVDFVRCWFQWNFFEQVARSAQHPQSSSAPLASPSSDYLFPLDDFVSKMAEAGVGVIGVVGSGYKRFLPVGAHTDNLDVYVKQLTESSTEIVRHYKDTVKVWQIENEPNWWKQHYLGQWRRGVIWLTRRSQEPILSALHNVVRSECPDATIIVNLEADEKDANWKLFAKYADFLGLDFYPNYFPRTPVHPSKLGATALEVRKQTGLPIFVIETGYPTGPRLFGYDEAKQCQYIRTACETAFTCDAITGLGWFRFSDSYWLSFPPQENHFGLLNKEGRPKAGWYEYVNQITQKR